LEALKKKKIGKLKGSSTVKLESHTDIMGGPGGGGREAKKVKKNIQGKRTPSGVGLGRKQ